MTPLLTLLKTVGGPGSLGFFVTAAIAGIVTARLWPSTRRVVLWGAGALMAAYLTMATPVVATTIVQALPLVAEPDPITLRSIRTLVIFDGDNLAGRQRQARRVLRRASPAVVHLLGADYLLGDLRMAVRVGTALHHDATTWNTSAQVMRVREIAERLPPSSTAVIASRLQMPRIAALMRMAGTDALLIPSDLDQELPTSGFDAVRPSYAALLASRDAIYEHAALAWYGWRGELR